MASLPTSRFLSLIPTLHESAVIIDSPIVELSQDEKAIEAIEKTRRSSSSASEASMPGDVVGQIQKHQFLKLGH